MKVSVGKKSQLPKGVNRAHGGRQISAAIRFNGHTINLRNFPADSIHAASACYSFVQLQEGKPYRGTLGMVAWPHPQTGGVAEHMGATGPGTKQGHF